jgi:aryl-alcohol dehydrogenase-like predicted oxidoreductase
MLKNGESGSTKVFGHFDNPEVSEEIITTAYENGINHFDVSDPYQVGRSEQELGRILRKKGWPRRSYYISTRIYWHK